MKKRAGRIGLLLIMMFLAGTLYAHPHMWIRCQLLPKVSYSGLVSVRVIWDLDEYTSSDLILFYDDDGNGEFEESENENLRIDAFEHLIESDYYLVTEVRNVSVYPGQATNFKARIQQGCVVYDFIVPFPTPIPWSDMSKVHMFLFDQSYFIDFRSEDLSDSIVTWQNRRVEFRKVQHRSMSFGYGLIEISGLEAHEIFFVPTD